MLVVQNVLKWYGFWHSTILKFVFPHNYRLDFFHQGSDSLLSVNSRYSESCFLETSGMIFQGIIKKQTFFYFMRKSNTLEKKTFSPPSQFWQFENNKKCYWDWPLTILYNFFLHNTCFTPHAKICNNRFLLIDVFDSHFYRCLQIQTVRKCQKWP